MCKMSWDIVDLRSYNKKNANASAQNEAKE